MPYIHSQKHLKKAVAELRARDPMLDALVRDYGVPPLRLRPAGFEGLVRILIGQQVSVAAANAILKKFEAVLPETTPQGFLALDEEALAHSGLSRPKRGYIRGLAEAICDGTLDLDALAKADPETVKEKLMQLKGIGPWTAEIYLLSCLGYADSFPAGDLALQAGLQLLADLPDRPTAEQTTDYAEKWRPYRAIAARMIWVYYTAYNDSRKRNDSGK